MIQLNDSQALMIEAFAGCVAEEVQCVSDSMDAFEAKFGPGEVKDGSLVGGRKGLRLDVPARVYREIQIAKGSRRFDLFVLDFGDFRAVYGEGDWIAKF